MTGRLSKLQRWILQKTLQYGTEYSEEGVTLLRKQLLQLWRRERYSNISWASLTGEEWFKARGKFNVSLTRSILNLRNKGLVRTFTVERPDLELWLFKDAARSATFSAGLKRMAGQDASEEDEVIRRYKLAKEAKRKGYANFQEVKADDEHTGSIQAVSLTAKGKEVALTLTLPETPKVSNKEELSTGQVSGLQTASPVTDTAQPVMCMQEVFPQ